MSGTKFTSQRHFRFRSDTADPTVSTAGVTWEAAEDTNIVYPSNGSIRCRFVIDNTGTAAIATNWRLLYSHNGAAYTTMSTAVDAGTGVVYGTNMTAAATAVQFSSALAVMTPGSGGATTFAYTEASSIPNNNLTSVQYAEFDFAIKINSTVADGDTIDLRVTENGSVLDSYIVTPRITVGSTVQGTFQLGTQVF